ncbi:hypothetical protein GIB67_027700 [Kingdonia uniflora]|uniref:Uncharacterized protein n=1 Tax=Kingdonia uniflora TaxID=39325 RepID=A0A7J7NLT1_9MAGN|nr:hypothetical protein GIB67_027700 [Kingdonia uniflora]
MAAKVALSPGSQSQKVDSIFAKPLINQTLATPAKVFQFVQKIYIKEKYFLMLAWESIVKPRKLTILDTLSTSFCFVCLDEGLRTIGTIMETRDWTLPALFLVDSSDRKLQMDVKRSVKKCVDDGKTVNLYNEIKVNIITNALKYSLATRNWGKANAAGTRARVSMVGVVADVAFEFIDLDLFEHASYYTNSNVIFVFHLLGVESVNICIYFVALEKACGLVKNLALIVYITVGLAANPILEFLEWSNENFEILSSQLCAY